MSFDRLEDPETAVALARGLKGRTITRVDIECHGAAERVVLLALHLDDGRVVCIDDHDPELGLSVYLDADLDQALRSGES